MHAILRWSVSSRNLAVVPLVKLLHPVLNGVVRFRGCGLAVAIVLAILAVGPASRLTLDESIESFYAPDDPLLIRYVESKQSFGGDEFVMVAYRLEAPLDFTKSVEREPQKSVLDELAAFSAQLAQVPGVQAASTQDLVHILRNEQALTLAPLGSLRLPIPPTQ